MGSSNKVMDIKSVKLSNDAVATIVKYELFSETRVKIIIHFMDTDETKIIDFTEKEFEKFKEAISNV